MGIFDKIFDSKSWPDSKSYITKGKGIKKILIVEDDPMVAELLVDNIETLNCTLYCCYDGETGWLLAQKVLPELVIQDIGLPKMDGFELCRLIKGNTATKHAHIIMLTGKDIVKDMEKAFTLGAEAYVNKPFMWERMLKHIRNFLGPEVG